MLRLLIALIFANIACAVRGQEQADVKPADYVKSALLQVGQIERGQVLFASERLACAKCHSINGHKSKAAPDLSAVGEKFGRREIIESVLTPSARIAEGYETNVLLMNDGKTLTGAIKSSTAQSIELLTTIGELLRVAADEIDTQRTSPTSIMPEGIHKSLSKSEFNDLIEYLVSLKQGETSTRINQGMPSQIEELRQPVEVRPIIDPSLKFNQPVWLGSLRGTDDQLLVIEHQVRKIWRLRTAKDGGAGSGCKSQATVSRPWPGGA